MVSSVSESAMNSWSLVGRTDEIFRMAGFAFATSTIILAGQNFGRNQLERVKQIYKTNVVLGLICCLLLALIYNLIAHPLFSLFSSVSLAFILVYWFGLGLHGVFIAIAIVNSLFLFVSYFLTQLYLKKMKFKNITS
ncbi:MATE family efflux transporter [Chengkuizengella axinellae]|uniref:MATE family efflux transporter n=1 Tax=Chengkuizengella axinellae TaxID=3064388 RepID=A0ABT9IVJ3_9BACL|nr:MATE family efflux transporter [Chengkuizengella sp. 2205SS18-9]MDP5273384.1 MATE family efflux transporter [Chengkuizengella sp. 2205SS18-9]